MTYVGKHGLIYDDTSVRVVYCVLFVSLLSPVMAVTGYVMGYDDAVLISFLGLVIAEICFIAVIVRLAVLQKDVSLRNIWRIYRLFL